MAQHRVRVGGPYFEDLAHGQVFDDAPGLTLTPGHAAIYQALSGDRLRLPLDHQLSAEVTGRAEPLAHPTLVCHVAIGQTTAPSQRVRGNLFYRGLRLLRPVHLGDTLRTRTEIVALRQNRPKPGRPATGLAVLRVQVSNQSQEPVLDYWRCPMIPLRDPGANTGHADNFDDISADAEPAEDLPWGWRLEEFRPTEAEPGTIYDIEVRDTVTGAPELARATLNLAAAHTDPGASAYGRRLVYGGHTISIAGAHATRALPHLVTIVAWRSCDHTGPVFEGDVLRTELHVEAVHQRDGYQLIDLRAMVHGCPAADAGDPAAPEKPVLDWRFVALAR
ncbi:MAG TPA: MaoC family dehydratase [Pseudonocardiaceae bacterium]|nr:MaoC family dehydratase [Pseudonocardiaceae bacterium]